MSYHIFHNVPIKASAEKIYNAVSDPNHLIHWWPQKCEGSPDIGCVYNLFFTDQYDWYAEVIKAEPHQSFHLKMTKSDDDWDPTSFGFDIVKNQNNSTLQFWHKNWPNCNDHFKHSSFCWAILLKGLKEYLESGSIIPFEKRS